MCIPAPWILTLFGLSIWARIPVEPEAMWHHTFAGGCWETSVQAIEATGSATWQTTFVVGEYQLAYTPWRASLRARYGTGSQRNFVGSGALAGGSGGTDRFATVDFMKDWRFPTWDLRALVGYGWYQWETTVLAGPRRGTSEGARLGLETSIPFYTTRQFTFSFEGKAALQTDSSYQLTGAFRVKFNAPAYGRASGEQYALASLTNVRDGFDPWARAEFFYSVKNSPYRWSGYGVMVYKTF